jgi:sugar phosphate isomerase/epimerase
MTVSRRKFLQATASAATIAAIQRGSLSWAASRIGASPFHLAVISDEISQDFDHACAVISGDFGLQWVELRGMWGNNLQNLSDAELTQVEAIVHRYGLRVTDIASPLFKADWPGAPRSHFSPKNDSFHASFGYQQQRDVLDQSIALAKRFHTSRVRCFDFWRLEDVRPYRAAINEELRKAADTCGRQGVLLVLENEFECNTATGREAAETLAAIPSPNLMLNWDPGNAVMAGELDAYPTAWALLPKDRIGHCHCKNAVRDAEGKIHWAPVGTGYIDWAAQFRALARSGYRHAVSLETHWRGGESPEASTRISWQQMKVALQQAGTLTS